MKTVTITIEPGFQKTVFDTTGQPVVYNAGSHEVDEATAVKLGYVVTPKELEKVKEGK